MENGGHHTPGVPRDLEVPWSFFMPYQVYKVAHIAAILLLFASLGGLAIFSASSHADEAKAKSLRILLIACHGISLVLILVAGFGLLARIGIKHGVGWPTWVYIKLVLWILLGAAVALYKRMPGLAKGLFFAMPLLGAIAAGVAVYKPGHEAAMKKQAEAIAAKAKEEGTDAKAAGKEAVKKATNAAEDMSDKAKAVAADEAKAAAANAVDPAEAAAKEAAAKKAEQEASP